MDTTHVTNDQFARYVDLQARLEETSDPNTIAVIKDEMGKLQEKSGLSNDELSTMLGLNEKLTETMPNATTQITDQGEKIAGTTEQMQRYNDEIQKMATRELEDTFYKQLENQNGLLKERNQLETDLKETRMAEDEIYQMFMNYDQKTLESKRSSYQTTLDELDAQIQKNINHGESTEKLQRQKDIYTALLNITNLDKNEMLEILNTYREQNTEQQKKIDKKTEELSKIDQTKQKLQEQYLTEAGITGEKAEQAVKEGKASSIISEQLGKLQSQKAILQETTPVQEKNTQEYRDAIAEIDTQIGKLQTAKGNIDEMTGAASTYNSEIGKDINKNVNTNVSPSAATINGQLSETVWKTVAIRYSANKSGGTSGGHAVPIGYAEGTDFHPGGTAIAGEEGEELARVGNKWTMLGFGAYDLPRGTQVFTHDETKSILRAMKNMPAYASGVSPTGEADRIINSLSAPSYDREVVGLLKGIERAIREGKVIYADGRVLGQVAEPHITDIQNRRQISNARARGITT